MPKRLAFLALLAFALPASLSAQGRQVVIEARVLELSHDFDFLGVRLGAGAGGFSVADRPTRFIGTAGTTFTGFDNVNMLNIGLETQVEILQAPSIRTSDEGVATIVMQSITPYATASLEIVSEKFTFSSGTSQREFYTGIEVGAGARAYLGTVGGERESGAQIPFLGDVAIVGRLFQGEVRARVKATLLVFVTPTIIQGS